MNAFDFQRATDEDRASAIAEEPDTAVIAGGTTLVDLMRIEVMRPTRVVDITTLPLAKIEPRGGSLMIGANVKNSDVADHPAVRERFPVLAQALLSGASPPIRNMASVGGNLLQRTRCPYFRDTHTACNKREPGSGCSALDGYTRSHAILGTSDKCIATHPSDMCVALVALDAVVHVRSVRGVIREIPIADFHALPGDHPDIESALARGELILAVELPDRPFASHSHYEKVRDRAEFSFALASCAAALDVHGGKIRDARVALGGVATKPWRAKAAEDVLRGKAATRESFEAAATAALAGAAPRPDNAFKVELARRTLVRALMKAGGVA